MNYNPIPNPIAARLAVGQRICGSQFRDGIIYRITGQQRPETVTIMGGGAMVTGGNALLSIVFENGSKAQELNEAVVRGLPWQIYDAVATQEEIDEALLFAEAEDIRAKEELKLQEENREARRQTALAENPHLEQVPKNGYASAVIAARNIRKELKQAFPRIKFSVRSRGGDAVYVNWSLGPTQKEVESVIGKYERGYFDGSDDCYKYDKDNIYPELFGGAKYVVATRKLDVGVAAVGAGLCEIWKLGKPLPTENFWRMQKEGDIHSVGEIAFEILAHQSFPPGAVITGVEHCKERRDVYASPWANWYSATYDAQGPR